MQPTDFTGDSPGKLVQSPEGFWVYIPDPLPPQIEITWELAGQIASATQALAELAGITRTLPSQLFIKPFIHHEAVLSSRIEGTQTEIADLYYFEATDKQTQPDVREVANYVNALEYGIQRLETLPLSLRFIRELHERLLTGVRGQEKTPGEFRRIQNWIGRPGSTPQNALFVPPPVHEMQPALDAFEKYLHQPSPFPPLVRIALIHYQFETIHPFMDGNGRVGRLLNSLLLITEKLLSEPVLYLSAFFERHRRQYYQCLQDVKQQNDWPGWISFFLEGVRTQSISAVTRAHQLIDLAESYRKIAQAGRPSPVLLQLVELLFIHPVITINMVALQLNVSRRAASVNIQKLVDEKILVEQTGRQRNRVYQAAHILAILNQDWP